MIGAVKAWDGALGIRSDRLTHVRELPARPGTPAQWPDWVPAEILSALRGRGVLMPWQHQVEAAEELRAGRNVAIATGTASGKSLAYMLPALTAICEGAQDSTGRGASVLYLAPTKALAHDQGRSLTGLGIADLRVAAYDGDTDSDERAWARAFANWIVTNPDMVHRGILPRHHAWRGFLRSLRYVVIDESHAYRGVFGSHTGLVLRRLLRIARSYGADPAIVCASATSGDPASSAERLVGQPFTAITEDASPRAGMTFALLEPMLLDGGGENDAPTRRSALTETAELLCDMVVAGVRTLGFVRSRRGVEVVATTAKELVEEVDPELVSRIAAYRGGYLPEERRALEADLRDGRLLGLAATNALELGIDVSGLDVVAITGWPGSHASLWQQAGRAGRQGQDCLAVMIARDDPLDTYVVNHPEVIFDRDVESAVCDPGNPYVLGPHLCAAAAEIPLGEAELADVFGPSAPAVADDLVERGYLRRRPTGLYWTRPEQPAANIDLRGIGPGPVRIVEQNTGRLLGTVDHGAAPANVHEGAVYVHQGRTHLIRSLDLDESVAMAQELPVDYSTTARSVSDIRVIRVDREGSANGQPLGIPMKFGTVDVSSQVVAFLRRRVPSGEVLGEEPLDLPPSRLRTRAVWWELDDRILEAAELTPTDVPGAIHAAEHAAIGLLPLFATCDRLDIGGLSTPSHPDSAGAAIFIYDGHPGGAGFAERGFTVAEEWLSFTRDAIRACPCPAGCPSCVQSPKCGNGNDPLDKAGAIRLLDVMLKTH